eukprot:scaffold196_cov371-Prasinococcus_capsulatus_cf.AAC.5
MRRHRRQPGLSVLVSQRSAARHLELVVLGVERVSLHELAALEQAGPAASETGHVYPAGGTHARQSRTSWRASSGPTVLLPQPHTPMSTTSVTRRKSSAPADIDREVHCASGPRLRPRLRASPGYGWSRSRGSVAQRAGPAHQKQRGACATARQRAHHNIPARTTVHAAWAVVNLSTRTYCSAQPAEWRTPRSVCPGCEDARGLPPLGPEREGRRR